MVKGEITAFVSLIFVLVFSFIAAMLESTVQQVTKNQKRLDADRAVFSVFGEYEKELLEKFDILAVDSGYGTGAGKEENLTDRMHYYGTTDMEHTIVGIQYLPDKQGLAFREQAVAFMEDRYGLSIIQELAGKTGLWEEQELQGEEALKQDTLANLELEEALAESESALPEDENPILHMENIKKSGLLSLVLPREFQLSQKQILQEGQPSTRDLQSGRGSFYMRQGMDGISEKLLFHEYLLKKFGSAAEEKGENKSLSYELEYMLGEQNSDARNLEAVVKKLLGIRFGINFLYLQTDPAKQAEAQTLALTLSSLAALPMISEVVKQALLAAWAFGESMADLRSLLSGKRAALIKNSSNWQLSLAGLMKLGTGEDALEGMDAEGGLTYTDYLRILLFLKSEDSLAMKALDLIEQNMRTETNNSSFCIDSCVVKLKTHSKAIIRDGLTYQFPTYFGYEF